jgi:hypothetical protein
MFARVAKCNSSVAIEFAVTFIEANKQTKETSAISCG